MSTTFLTAIRGQVQRFDPTSASCPCRCIQTCTDNVQGPDLHIHHTDDVLASMNEWSEVRSPSGIYCSCYHRSLRTEFSAMRHACERHVPVLRCLHLVTSASMQKTHGESGLTERCRDSIVSMADAEEQVLSFVKRHCRAGKACLCSITAQNPVHTCMWACVCFSGSVSGT